MHSSMAHTFMSLPDETLQAITRYLSIGHLECLALTCKRLHSISLPELFRYIDLGKRDASELSDYLSCLYGLGSTELCGEEGRSRLADVYIQHVSGQLIEDMAGDKEFQARQKLAMQALRHIKGPDSFALEVSLTEEPTAAFDSVFLPAYRATLEAVKQKSPSKVELWVDAFGGPMQVEEEASSLLDKVSKLLEATPLNVVTSFNFNGIGISDLPESLKSKMAADNVRTLTLKECSSAFARLPVLPNLKSLTVSWGAGPSDDCADLKTVFEILQASSSTVESIILQNIMSTDYSGVDLSQAVHLPQLKYLQLADSNLSDGSLLSIVTSFTHLPKLQTLDLETEDIINTGPLLCKAVENLPTLKALKVNEARLRKLDESTEDPCDFVKLRALCHKANIVLECTYSCLRCDTSEDLTVELQRVALLGGSLKSLSIACHPDALAGSHWSTARKLSLPGLRRLSIGVTDFVMSETNGEATTAEPSIASLTNVLHAPGLVGLQVTLFINTASAEANFQELKQIIRNDAFPNLERLGGALMPSQHMSAASLRAYGENLNELCRQRGIDNEPLNLISRDDLNAAVQHEVEDEWIDSDEEVEEDQVGSFEDESDLESGYGENVSPLPTIKEDARENDRDGGDQLDSEMEATDDGHSTSSDSSWTSEESDNDLRFR